MSSDAYAHVLGEDHSRHAWTPKPLVANLGIRPAERQRGCVVAKAKLWGEARALVKILLSLEPVAKVADDFGSESSRVDGLAAIRQV